MRVTGLWKLAAKIAAIFSLALMLGGVISPIARAGDNQAELFIRSKMDEWAALCREQGGQPQVFYDLMVDGSTYEARLDCFGAFGLPSNKGWWCTADFAYQTFCNQIFTQPAQTPADVAVPSGSVTEAYDEGPTPTPVVVQQSTTKPDAPTRPTSTPTPEPTEREGR